MSRKRNQIIQASLLLIAVVLLHATAAAFYAPWQLPGTLPKTDTAPARADTLKFPLQDRRGDFFTHPSRNPFDLKDPANIHDSIEYDPKTNQYYIVEKIGDFYYRKPTYLTFDEFMKIEAQKSEDDYFQHRANVLSDLNRKLLHPGLTIHNNFFNRIFGSGQDGLPKVDIRPQGTVSILAGYQGQNIKNPALPERARRNGGFDFNMNANLSVIGNIGDKLKLPINYNTQANFDFENQLKLDYTGKEDEIIKHIEAGNISFSSKGTLIPGVQSLFGVKTQLQFGKLFVTGVLANQRSQSQSRTLTGGSATTRFEFKADDYDENRHFLLAQYFHDNYNKAMAKLPIIQSKAQILKIEVWVTNKNGATTDTRDVVGLMDLGEPHPYSPGVHSLTNVDYPFNAANDLYNRLVNDPASRNSSSITSKLNSLGLTQVQDFEKTYARKLSTSEYTYNDKVGFISLNVTLQPDDVLAVAYQYSYNGKIYQVGEFSEDVPPDSSAGTQKILFLKLLKATAQRTNLPIWNLMMKNVYALKAKDGSYLSSVQADGFDLNVLYSEPSLGQKRYLPEGPKSGAPLISLLNLDRLNSRNDPQPDGKFDYLEGYTIVSSQAMVIFPLLEPFGRDLDSVAFQGASTAIRDKYVYYPLYDTIKEIAKTYANLDRFVISGTAQGSSSSEVSLGAFNIPQGSVTVTAGGQVLTENVDYQVDYNLGTVKILNTAILNSGVPVNVQYENNAGFGIQNRNFMGLRFDYQAKNTATESLTIGGTIERLGERPFFTKTNYNEDPIRNTMYGLDFNYRTQAPRITRWLNKLPFYHTTEMSTVTAYGEGAYLKPGHPPQIGKGSSGQIYIDDFEGSQSDIDLRIPLVNWGLSATPAGNGLFPEATYMDSLPYGYNRAKIAWYNIEPILQDKTSGSNPLRSNPPAQGLNAELLDPRVRAVKVTDLFPNRSTEVGQAQLVTFDVAYYPTERGPYNFDDRAGSVSADGKLLNPEKRWGGIMRGLDQTDFETGNVEFIEFWLQDPFLLDPNSSGGQLYFDLGNVSEDVLKDGKRFFENGISGADTKAEEDTNTVWGKVPANSIQVADAFSNDPADRPLQDAGFDGLTDDAEKNKFSKYLTDLANQFGAGSAAYQQALGDPATDDFKNYRDASYDQAKAGILARYKDVNGPQGNSPVASSSSNYVSAFTLYPDQEEYNKDNTLNELEEYFEYKVNLVPADLQVGQNFITDERVFTPRGSGTEEKWYLFRIPIEQYTQKVGNISDFKSIRFVRMYLTGFQDSVVLRFAKLDLVRNVWRQFNYQIDTTGAYTTIPSNSATSFTTLAVNIEENSQRVPIPYQTPPGIERQQQLSNNNVNLLLNEQAMSLKICDLPEGESRGVFKTLNLDLRRYGRMQMFVHAEAVNSSNDINDNELYAVIRMGDDIASNYYEVRIPLKITPWGSTVTAEQTWPTANDLDIQLSRLTALKVARNKAGPSTQYYKETDTSGKEYAILGNPNLGEISVIFLGVENRSRPSACTEVWFNELRLSDINEKGGYAALGRVDFKLADLGTLYVSGSTHSSGWGTIDQGINERSTESLNQFDVATNLELGKLLPARAGVSIPFYGSFSKTVSTPEYDPYDLDIKLKDKLAGAVPSQRDSIRNDAISVKTIKTFNFTNVKKLNTSGKKQKIWSLSNIDLSYSYYKESQHTPLIEEDEVVRHRVGVGYNYASTPHFWQPLRPVLKTKSPWLTFIKEFNLNPNPSLLSFRADINRQFGAYRARSVGVPKGGIPETYDKYFTFDRTYNLRWDLTRSFNIDFNAVNRAYVDEDSGRLDKEGRRRMWDNFWKGGRTISYQQTANFSYNLPTTKFPFLDWTTVRAGYVASFNWLGASLLAKSLGNTISNTQQKTLTAELDFSRLYNKSRLLRSFDQPGNASRPKSGGKQDTTGNKKPNENLSSGTPGTVKFLGRLVTALKRMSIDYSENSSSTIYGFTDSSKVLGMDFKSMAPGLDYVFGRQPDSNFINYFARKGWLTGDPDFNYSNEQNYSQKLSVSAQLIPVRDLTVDLNLDKTFGKSYSELYKDTIGYSGYFARLNPYTSGSFSISYISYKTLFEKIKPNEVSKAFQKFQEYRSTISERLAKSNQYIANPVQNADGYYEGYDRYAQEVLIPAFIAAYTGKNPNSVPLTKQSNANIRSNPFSGLLPKPNWRITYNGLSRIPGLDKIFTNFTISHAYNSTLSMNSFSSELLFEDPLHLGSPYFIDTLTGNYVPYFLVPNITISEQFAPLISVDMQFANQLSANVEYKKSRQLSLSLVDYQVSESRSTELTIGAGFRQRGVLSFLKWKGKRLSNDVQFRLDFSLRDDVTANSRLDQSEALPTSGQKVIFINPTIDYVINNRLNVKLYFEQRRTEPKISTSPPITNTRAGVEIQISLAK